jgi:hypothetical protein
VQLGVARHFGVAVARQVDQQRFDLVDAYRVLAVLGHVGAADRKVIDVLGAAGRLGRERKTFLVGQDIDRRGFARVRAPGESDFRHLGRGQFAQLVDGSEETGLPEFGHGRGDKDNKMRRTGNKLLYNKGLPVVGGPPGRTGEAAALQVMPGVCLAQKTVFFDFFRVLE